MVKDILNLESAIFEMYYSLMNIEKNEGCKNEKYIFKVKILNHLIERENKLLDKFSLNDMDNFEKIVKSDVNYDKSFSKDELIKTNLILSRIYNTLVFSEYNKSSNKIMNEKTYIKNIDARICADTNIERIRGLNDLIKHQEDTDVKNMLIVTKYEALYTSLLLGNEKKDNIQSLEKLGFDKFAIDYRISNEINYLIKGQIRNASILTNERVKVSKKDYRNLLLTVNELRIGLSLCNKNTFNDIYFNMCDYINSLDDASYNKSSIAYDTIYDVMSNMFKKKNKTRVYSRP